LNYSSNRFKLIIFGVVILGLFNNLRSFIKHFAMEYATSSMFLFHSSHNTVQVLLQTIQSQPSRQLIMILKILLCSEGL